MKRISVPLSNMIQALTTLNVNCDQADDIISLFEVVDAGNYDAVVMPVLSFNANNQLSRKDVLITLFAFWYCVAGCTDSRSDYETEAFGAIRSLYFVSVNFGYNDLSAYITTWWEQTAELHGSHALELWA